ncbi:hypothetical protein ANANG_G00075180 [Anguilla anguilla]|uniref:AIG1-type G domain-containing protein n=1 Tax=Anguilla anguilla TaxID=7936 RepID=A0A9D3S071_ANGAN|nr:hypothetical protein ANANG_G00075180 [Anguilla anguilla]
MATDSSLLRNDESKELRIVLLGGRWGGKSSAGNTILGEERFESGRQRTAKSDDRHATVAGRKLILVDTPGWKGHLSLRETTEADRREIKQSVCKCPPGPHAFLLVVPVDSAFTEEHRRSLVDHLTLLGDKVWKYSMVLFTCGDWLREKSIEEHIETEGDALQWLTDKCRNRFHILNNKNREDPTQVSQLLDKIEEMVAENNGGHFEVDESTRQMILTKKMEVEAKATERKMQTDKRREELSRLLQGAEQPTELRVVLLGSRNAGKSASGNTILGSEEFDIKKGTSKSVVKRACVEGTPITIVDTPGWWQGFSVRDTTKQGKQELTRSASLCPPGPHVFLLVIDTDVAFTERQREAVEEHLQLISGRAWNRTMILFSRADWLGAKSIEQHIEEEGKALQWLVEKCGNRYHALDNKNKDNKAQVAELLQKMKEVVAGNGGSFHEVDGRALQSIEEDRKAVEEKAKRRMTKAKEQRKRFQGTNIHLPEMKVVLMGQKSSGKNAVGTTMLDRDAFPSCETACCEIEEGVVFGRRLTVVNTPGWWDNLARCTLEQDKEIMRGLSLCLPGPHTVLLVIPVDVAYRERHRRALEDHLCCLGEDVWRHTIVLFTYGDRLGETSVEQHIEREGWPLQWVVEKCGNRYQLFNNKNRGDGAQVAELLEKMEEMVAGNDGEQFSPDMSQVYREVENELKRKVAEEMKVCYVEEMNWREKELKEQFEEEWRRREKELFEKFGDSSVKGKQPAKLKIKPSTALPSKERKIRKEQRKNEEKTSQDNYPQKLSEGMVSQSRGWKLRFWMRNSLEFGPPSMSEGMDSQNSSSNLHFRRRNSLEFGPPSIGGSTEQMWTESTTGPQEALRKRRQSWSPSTFSTASTGQDSGITSRLGSLRSLTISEYPAESDAALPPGTGSR